MVWLLEHETTARASMFMLFLAVFFAIGIWRPARRCLAKDNLLRWRNNLLLFFINSVAVRFLIPISLTSIAIYAGQQQIGILNHIFISPSLELALALITLDLWIYWQHRLFHKVPLLWRVHRVHHSDIELDVTTSGRFHLVEIALSFGIKATAILVIGVSPLAIIVFELMLNISAMFNHSNFNLPPLWERWIRSFIVTPAMHRIHHSAKVNETNSNFGFCLSWWDTIFQTYKKNSVQSDIDMCIGLTEFRSESSQTLLSLVLQPFRSNDISATDKT